MSPTTETPDPSGDSLVHWEISSTEVTTATTGEPGPCLAMAITSFLDGVMTNNWSDRPVFAGIMRDYTDLGAREIGGLLGMDPTAVSAAPSPSPPPWTVEHPEGFGKVRMYSETEE